jgi:hypothetical protein
MNQAVRELWQDIGQCKQDKTCWRLDVRTRWFEPNPGSIDWWKARGDFPSGVDRRVIFVCESPTAHGGAAPQFEVPLAGGQSIGGRRCWAGDNAEATDGFWQMRRAYGLHHTWITNLVKCGATVSAKPRADEVRECVRFLARELTILRPAVIAIVGKSDTMKMWRQARVDLSALEPVPSVIPISHFSYVRKPDGAAYLAKNWPAEFKAIIDELQVRGLQEPVWL